MAAPPWTATIAVSRTDLPPTMRNRRPTTPPLPDPHPRPTDRHLRCRGGFTLIEVMMVLLILGALIGLVVGLARHTRETAATAQAKAELGELHHALASFFSTHDAYPGTGRDPQPVTDVWLETPPWAPEPTPDTPVTNRWTLRYHLPQAFPAVDPWGMPYYYQHDATNAPLSYRLFSLGPRTNDVHARILFQP